MTLIFFIVSISLHWTFAWFAYVQEEKEHDRPAELSSYFNVTFRDTMENWQSEFLQLMWRIGGLSFLLYVGSRRNQKNPGKGWKQKDGSANQAYERQSGAVAKIDGRDRGEISKKVGALSQLTFRARSFPPMNFLHCMASRQADKQVLERVTSPST